MSIFDRLGQFTVRRPIALIIAAVTLAVLAVIGGSGVEDRLTNMNPVAADSDSALADQILQKQFRGGSGNYTVLVTARDSVDDPTVSERAARLVRTVEIDPAVESVSSYWTAGRPEGLRSRDGRTGLILVRLAGDNQESADAATRLTESLRAQADGLRLGFSGQAQVESEGSSRTKSDLQRAEAIALPISLLLLVLVFGSVAAAALPLVVGLLSIVSTLLVLRVLTEFTDVSIFALNIATFLGLGLAIDYSLFIVTRFREELAAGREERDALVVTMRTAGRTVAFSALTVAAALSALLVFPMSFLRSFGYAGIAVVLLSAAGALVVLPAVLALLGHRVNSLNLLTPVRRRHAGEGRGFWYRLARLVMRRPIAFGLATVMLLLVLGSPFVRVSFGLTDERVLPRGAQAQVATQQLRSEFQSAWTAPVVVPGIGAAQAPNRLPSYAVRLSQVPGVARVDTVTGSYAQGRLIAPPGPEAARYASRTDSWLAVATTTQPMSDQGTQLVHRLRAVPAPTDTLVTGDAAQLVDTRSAIGDRLPLAAGVIVLAMMLLLFLFTGSVLLPIKAIVLSTLSLTATLGAMVYVFQEGNLTGLIGHPIVTGTIDMTTPILMSLMAFGLSMDYEVFLLSRIQEDYRATGDTAHATAVGLQRTGRLVTSAAALMAVLLIAMATSGITPIKMLGIGMALAVMMDATVVRGILLPAVMPLAGRFIWWAPRPLRRLHDRIGLTELSPGPDVVDVGS